MNIWKKLLKKKKPEGFNWLILQTFGLCGFFAKQKGLKWKLETIENKNHKTRTRSSSAALSLSPSHGHWRPPHPPTKQPKEILTFALTLTPHFRFYIPRPLSLQQDLHFLFFFANTSTRRQIRPRPDILLFPVRGVQLLRGEVDLRP